MKSGRHIDAPPAALFGVGLVVLLIVLGGLAIVGFLLPVPPAPYDPPFPPEPPPYTPDPPTPEPSDAISAAASHAIYALERAVPNCRRQARSEYDLRALLADAIRSDQDPDSTPAAEWGPFVPVNVILSSMEDGGFSHTFKLLAAGFNHAAGVIRTRDGPTSQLAASFGQNFAAAAKMAGDPRYAKEQLHAFLLNANHAASGRFIDAVARSGRREPPAAMMTGYLIDQEHRDELRATSIPLRLPQFAAPPEIDPRPWHRIEDQQSMGSCQGHALSSVCEYTHLVATKKPFQFSPLFAYYASQKRDGLLGRDVGSTIAGGLASAKEDGSCPDEIMPYRLPYTGRFAPGAYEAAKGFLIKRHSVCRDYADVFAFLASGQGGVEIGIRWPDQWMNCNGVLEHYSASGGGGHAVCFLGYSTRKDSQGRNYLWLANSWGTGWGSGGWALVAPQAVDQMARHPDTVMIGMSDMAVAKVRDVSWIGKGSVFGEERADDPMPFPLDVPVRVERAGVRLNFKGSVL